MRHSHQGLELALQTCLVSALICLYAADLRAQTEVQPLNDRPRNELSYTSPSRFGIGFRAGGVQFAGDLQEPLKFPGAKTPIHLSGSLFFHYRWLDVNDSLRLGLEAAVSYARLSSHQATYAFHSYAFPATVSLVAELYPMASVRPLLSFGLGVLPYDLHVEHNEVLSGFKEMTGSHHGLAVWFPVRFGLTYSLSHAIDVQLIYERSLTLSDKLDGLVSNRLQWMNDNFQGVSAGLTFYFLNDDIVDSDNDRLSDAEEVRFGTDPKNSDTDGDGLSDGDEVYLWHSSPTKVDTDNDGLRDDEEVHVFHTNPARADTDNDGISDKDEIAALTDPLNPDTDHDGIVDGKDRCPRVAGPAENGGCPVTPVPARSELPPATPDYFRLGQIFVIENIEFETGQAVITPESRPALDKLAKTLSDNPGVYFEIGGHTDSTGNFDRNITLSRTRAQAVREYLVQKGVAAERIEVHGYGSTQPVTTNATPEGRARNRRIEFRILQVKEKGAR